MFLKKNKIVFFKKIEFCCFSNFFFLKKRLKKNKIKSIYLSKRKHVTFFNNFWKRVLNGKRVVYTLLLMNYFLDNVINSYSNNFKKLTNGTIINSQENFNELVGSNSLNNDDNLSSNTDKPIKKMKYSYMDEDRRVINNKIASSGDFCFINMKLIINFKKKKKKININRAPYKNKISQNKFNFFFNKFKIQIFFDMFNKKFYKTDSKVNFYKKSNYDITMCNDFLKNKKIFNKKKVFFLLKKIFFFNSNLIFVNKLNFFLKNIFF